MKPVYPKLKSLESSYPLPKVESIYSIKKNVYNHQYQGHQGYLGKYYGNFANKINPTKLNGGMK